MRGENDNKFTCEDLFILKALKILSKVNRGVIPYPRAYQVLSFLHLSRDESRKFLKILVKKNFLKESFHHGYVLTKKSFKVLKENNVFFNSVHAATHAGVAIKNRGGIKNGRSE
jgi:hypothetical protein